MTAESNSNVNTEALGIPSADKLQTPAELTEDAALALLNSADTASETLARLARSPIAAKSRKVLLGVVQHTRTPRHVSIPLLRRLFTFDLMQVTLTPNIAADIKRAAEEQIIVRLEAIPAGQKITLARRASGRVAAALLQEPDARVISPALENPQLTEALVVRALMKSAAPEVLFRLASKHAKWSLRREIQIALLRSEKTPIERARLFAKHFPEKFLRDVLPETRKDTL
ncbi:MAG TPA: hypothetical protein VJO35_11525 [Terriglobales bacterium]|nr:hypothetical protein [Terriglobales bacterium]